MMNLNLCGVPIPPLPNTILGTFYYRLYDPEITGGQNNSYPTTKSWTTGLKVNF